MPPSTPSPLSADIAAALDWWRTAGVDAVFADAPSGWLSAPQTPGGKAATTPARPARIEPPAPPPPPRIGGDPAKWPKDLAAFRVWWLGDPLLDEGGIAPRVPPRGAAGADLMVLVDEPEEEDSEILLAGPSGRLLDAFLLAAGVDANSVYRASALPRRTPVPDWTALAADGLGRVLAHHVAVAAPKRLIVLGTGSLSLCGNDSAQGAQTLRTFNHEGGRVPMLALAGLNRLAANPPLRARAWQLWLDWTDG